MPANELMEGRYMRAALDLFAALDAEALHAEGARDVLAMLGLLNELAAEGAQLDGLAASRFVVKGVQVLFAGLSVVPRGLHQVAILEVTRHALCVEVCWRLEGGCCLAPRVRTHALICFFPTFA